MKELHMFVNLSYDDVVAIKFNLSKYCISTEWFSYETRLNIWILWNKVKPKQILYKYWMV